MYIYTKVTYRSIKEEYESCCAGLRMMSGKTANGALRDDGTRLENIANVMFGRTAQRRRACFDRSRRISTKYNTLFLGLVSRPRKLYARFSFCIVQVPTSVRQTERQSKQNRVNRPVQYAPWPWRALAGQCTINNIESINMCQYKT